MLIPNLKITNGVKSWGDYTQEFNRAIQTYGKRVSVRVENSLQDVIYDDDTIVSMRRFSDAGMFKSVMYCIELEVLGQQYNSGDTFTVYFGVSEDGVNYYYVSYGSFYCESSEQNLEAGTTKLTCYDRMIEFMKPYVPKGDDYYPVTNEVFLTDMLNDLNFQTQSYPVGGVMALERQRETYTEKYTYRDVLDDFAEVCGASIVIGPQEDVLFLYPTYTDISIDEENLKTITMNDEYAEITKLTLSRQPQNDNVTYAVETSEGEEVAGSEIRFDDNQIVEGYADNDRTPYLSPMLGYLSQLGSFYPFELDSYGYALLEPMDGFEVNLASGTYFCYWTNSDMTVNQGLTETANTTKPEDAEVDYTMTTDESKRETATYLYVDKVSQQIQSVVSDLENYSTITQTQDAITQAVGSIVVPTEDQIKQYAQTVLTESGLEVTINNVNTDLNGKIQALQTLIRLGADGVEVGRENDDIIGLFGNSQLGFYLGSTDGTLLAWLGPNNGLGAPEVSVGDATNPSNRWRLITRDNMSHFTITRHID